MDTGKRTGQDIDSRADNVAFWERAAAREELIGNHATAITYRNMAWIIANPELWVPGVIKSASEQAEEYIERMDRLSRD